MFNRIAVVALLGATMIVSGCASMSSEECVASDWRSVGYEDGSRGYTSDRIGNYRKACAKHGVTPDLDAYQAGRVEGLKEFCQPQRGFNVGASGGRYNGVCPSHLEPDFLDAYRTGARLHTLRSNVNSATYQINAKERELDNLDRTVRNKQATLIADETTVQDRVLLLSDLKELSERKGQLEAEIVDLIEDRAHHEAELASYEAVLADAGY